MSEEGGTWTSGNGFEEEIQAKLVRVAESYISWGWRRGNSWGLFKSKLVVPLANNGNAEKETSLIKGGKAKKSNEFFFGVEKQLKKYRG